LPLFAKDPGTDASEPPFAERAGADADDAILARAAFVGQVWAQREIWFRFAPMVYGLFRRVLRQRPDHDDLTQEVFLRVFRKLHTLEKASALRSFVYSGTERGIPPLPHPPPDRCRASRSRNPCGIVTERFRDA
jgi:hypothetical protein